MYSRGIPFQSPARAFFALKGPSSRDHDRRCFLFTPLLPSFFHSVEPFDEGTKPITSPEGEGGGEGKRSPLPFSTTRFPYFCNYSPLAVFSSSFSKKGRERGRGGDYHFAQSDFLRRTPVTIVKPKRIKQRAGTAPSNKGETARRRKRDEVRSARHFLSYVPFGV